MQIFLPAYRAPVWAFVWSLHKERNVEMFPGIREGVMVDVATKCILDLPEPASSASLPLKILTSAPD